MNTSDNREQRPTPGTGIALSVLIVVGAAVLVLLLAGCSAEGSARAAYSAFSQPCNQDSFTYKVEAMGPVRTFTATCKVRS